MRYGDRNHYPPRFRHGAVAAALLVCALSLIGCAGNQLTPMRLYRLDTGLVIHAELYRLRDGHGTMSAMLPDGRALTGHYVIGPPSVAGEAPADAPEWAAVYGYGGDAGTRPAGVGHLRDWSGYTVDVIIYRVDPVSGYGTGLARDSDGRWYRMHLGRLRR